MRKELHDRADTCMGKTMLQWIIDGYQPFAGLRGSHKAPHRLVNVFNNDLHICKSCRGVILIPPALCDLHKGFLYPLDKSHKAGRTHGADYRQYNKLAESCQYRRRKFIIRKLKVYFQKKTRSPQEPTAGSAPETSAAKRRGLKIALAKPFQCPAA